jgi:hypothetical protein
METSVSLLGRLAGAPSEDDWQRLDDAYRPCSAAGWRGWGFRHRMSMT